MPPENCGSGGCRRDRAAESLFLFPAIFGLTIRTRVQSAIYKLRLKIIWLKVRIFWQDVKVFWHG